MTGANRRTPSNIVLVTLDCVRPEAFGCYPDQFPWWRRFPYDASTPAIDSLADDGTVYDHAVCQAPFTPASHASMFTGLNPYDHGIRRILGQKLAADVTTVTERLSAAGFDTAAFIGAHALHSDYGLDAGFDIYDEEFETTAENWELGSRRPCEEVMDNALSWLESDRSAPSFLFLHFFDAHDGSLPATEDGPVTDTARRLLRPVDERLGRPLEIREGYGRRFQLRQTSRIDRQLNRLITHLDSTGELPETMVFILADHGDAFGEHGEFNHREYLYDTTVRVPFVFRPDERAPPVPDRDGVVRSIDICPTILDRVGIETQELPGKSLFSSVSEDAVAYCETQFEEPGTDFRELRHSYAGLRTRRWKFIFDRQSSDCELYDLKRDSGERNDLSELHDEITDRLRTEVTERLAGDEQDRVTVMDDGERASLSAHLEGLGYL